MSAALDAPTSIVIDALDDLAIGDRPLIVCEISGRLASALTKRGASPITWLRTFSNGVPGSTWPPSGQSTAVLIRLPKAKDELDFLLHAGASVLPTGGLLLVFGGNDEGVRSAASHLDALCDDVATLVTRRHSRIVAGRLKAGCAIKGCLADWRREGQITLCQEARAWVSYPGVFAAGRLDDGTRVLLANLPVIPDTAHVLDFAAGCGAVGAAVLEIAPRARVQMIEIDALSAAAARENAPLAHVIDGDSLAAAVEQRFDVILSNPPIHDGVAETTAVLDRLIADAPRALKPRGIFQIVVQRRVKVAEKIEKAFGNVSIVADDGRFTVLSATKA